MATQRQKARCKEALALQDASNIKGVARALVRIIDDSLDEGNHSVESRYDPAILLTVAKLADMVCFSFNWPSKAEEDAEEILRQDADD